MDGQSIILAIIAFFLALWINVRNDFNIIRQEATRYCVVIATFISDYRSILKYCDKLVNENSNDPEQYLQGIITLKYTMDNLYAQSIGNASVPFCGVMNGKTDWLYKNIGFDQVIDGVETLNSLVSNISYDYYYWAATYYQMLCYEIPIFINSLRSGNQEYIQCRERIHALIHNIKLAFEEKEFKDNLDQIHAQLCRMKFLKISFD